MSHPLANTFFSVTCIVGMTNIAIAYGDDFPFKINTKRDDDKAEVRVEHNKATVSIYSLFGISQAVVERSGNNWPLP